jgi:hypothetical protein
MQKHNLYCWACMLSEGKYASVTKWLALLQMLFSKMTYDRECWNKDVKLI